MAKKQSITTFINIFRSLKTTDQQRRFMNALFTPSELSELSLRIEIVQRLIQGDSQRNIARDLGVGIATVSRGARLLKYEIPNMEHLFILDRKKGQ